MWRPVETASELPRRAEHKVLHASGGVGGTSSIRPPSLGTLAFQMRSLLARLGSCLVTYICKDEN